MRRLETADKLASSVNTIFGDWQPGDEVIDLTITGAGPVWGYLKIAHNLHGKVARLTYAAPNAQPIEIFSHGI